MFLYLLLSLLLSNPHQTTAIPPECLETVSEIIQCDETDEMCTATQELEINICEIHDTDESKGECNCVFPDNSIVNRIFPVIITEPGQYCLGENLFIPRDRNGIIIEANNVTLDLNGYVITGAPNSTNGILVRRGTNEAIVRNNIIIRNGTVRTMGLNGILVNTASRFFKFENLKLLTNRNNGLSITANQQLLINKCLTSQNGGNGIFINQSGRTFSLDCVIQNCFSFFNGTDGIQLSNCNNFRLSNNLCLNNRVDGFDEINGNRISFESCLAHSNGRNNTTGAGFFSSGNNNSFNQCQANNNNKIGFQLAGNGTTNGNGSSIENCEAKSNGINGFQIAGANHCILNNLAKSNITNGFVLLAGSTQCQLRSNTAVDNGTGISNNTTTVNRIYSNFASDNFTNGVSSNFFGVPNVSVSPGIATAINFTANIED